MAIFGPKPWVNPFREMLIFRRFELLVFIAQKNQFFVLEYHEIHFPTLYCEKKKLEKWPFLDQNHGLTPLEKCQFFDFLNFLFFIAQKSVFSFQNIIKDIFLSYNAGKKKFKMAIFGPKPWVNPFGKMSTFRLFELLGFRAQKSVFSFWNIIKDIFLAYIA